MRNPKYTFIAICAYLALICTLAITTARPAHTQGNGHPNGPDVRVINTSNEPVPVSLKGPYPVPVSLLQPNPVPVSIQGSDVNQSARPITTRDIENPANQPFQQSFDLGQTITVPPGKRLVIEFVTFVGNVNDGDPFSGQLTTTAGGTEVTHHFQLHEGHTTSGRHRFLEALSTRIYADPDTTVGCGISFRGDDAFMTVSISGFLVDLL